MRILGVTVVLICLLSLSFGAVDVHDISVDESYPFNQILKGEINLSISDEPVDTLFSTNRGHEFLLIDLLDNNAAIYDCNPYNCENQYTSVESGESIGLSMSAGSSRYVGFELQGEDLIVDEIEFELSSDFGSGEVVPIRINFFETPGLDWTYDLFSATDYRTPDYGHYDESYRQVGPVIGQSTYCTQFGVFETDKLLVGLDFELEGGTGEIEIILYNDLGQFVTSGSFDPSESGPPHINNVILQAPEDDIFSAGLYYVCVKAEDDSLDYRIYSDSDSGSYRGFSYRGDGFDFEASISQKDINYAIFIAEYIYADSSKLGEANFSEFLEGVNDYIDLKYGGDCSDSCSIPMRIHSGVSQDLVIRNIKVNYGVDYGDDIETKIHVFNQITGDMSYSGVLDLSALGFRVNESGEYVFYIGGEEIYETDIEITPAPLIEGVYPTFIPAGIESKLFADILYEGDNSTLTYDWVFGDGSSQTTDSNEVFHLYSNISEFTVKLNVTVGNLSNSFEQKIETINPQEYVVVFYDLISEHLNNSKKDILTFPTWQQKAFNSALKIIESEDEIARIERKISEAYEDDHYLEVAGLINALDLPRSVYIREEYPIFGPEDGVMNINAVSEYTAESLDQTRTEDEYVNAIAFWQEGSISYTGNVKKTNLLRSSGMIEELLTTYFITVQNDYDREAFLVLDIPLDQIVFNNLESSPKSYGGATIITLKSGANPVEFYLLGHQDINFFSSPFLRDLVLEADINENCNFNYICEEGEDYNTCRSDCKPVNLMILYIVLAFLFGIVLYTVVQIWYDKNYEKTLFPDENRLYNLMVYVITAQNKGMSTSDIKKSLKEKGWTSERINYVLKKVNGQRTGMYEIIPFSKISAARRRKEVNEKYSSKGLEHSVNQGFPSPHSKPKHIPPRKIHPGHNPHSPGAKNPAGAGATSFQQQRGRNINKGKGRNL